MNAHIVSRPLTKAECKGDTVKDLETNLCVQKCHKDCDPLAGETYNQTWKVVLDLLGNILYCSSYFFLSIVLRFSLSVDILLDGRIQIRFINFH